MSDIKIGKARYVALWSLSEDFSEEREQLLKPLLDIYSTIHVKADERVKEYSEAIKQAKKDAEIEGSWDPEEYSSIEALESFIDDIAFKFQLHRTAIAQSILITAQTYLHSKFQAAFAAYKSYHKSTKVHELRKRIFDLGPSIGFVTWAAGVKAASNYVRHYEEWHVETEIWKKRDDGQISITQRNDLFDQFKLLKKDKPGEIETVWTLIQMGFSEREVFDSRHNIAYKLVAKLKLNLNDEFSRNSGMWIAEIVKTLENDLPEEVRSV